MRCPSSHPRPYPQMADSEDVLKELDPPDDVEIIGIVVNEKGAQRAIETKAVSTLGFPYSISETFLRKNQNQSPEDALEELEKIQNKADDAGLEVVVYISMAFGNPYGDLWNPDEVVEAISSDGSRQPADDLTGRYGRHGQPAADQRSGRCSHGEIRLPGDWRAPCTAVPRRLPTRFWPPTMRAAVVSIPLWEASADVPLRKTLWLVTSPLRKLSKRSANEAPNCRSLNRWIRC